MVLPLMAIVYALLALVIVALNIDYLPEVLTRSSAALSV